MSRSKSERVVLVTQLPIDLQLALRDPKAFSPVGKVRRDLLVDALVVVGMFLAVVGVMAADDMPFLARPTHVLGIAGAALVGAALGHHLRADSRRGGFDLFGVAATAVLIVGRDRVRVIPAEDIDSATLAIAGAASRELADLSVEDANRVRAAIERASDPQQRAGDRWRAAPIGLPAIDSRYVPIIVGGVACAVATLGVCAALSQPTTAGVSWASVGVELAKFERVDDQVRAALLDGNDERLQRFIDQHRAAREAGDKYKSWFGKDEEAVVAAARARRARVASRMRRAQDIAELRAHWAELTSFDKGLEGVVEGSHLYTWQTERKEIEAEYKKLGVALVDKARESARLSATPDDHLVRLLATYDESRGLGADRESMLSQLRQLVDTRLDDLKEDLDGLLTLGERAEAIMTDEQKERLWNALTAHIPRATRLAQLSDMALYEFYGERERDHRIGQLMGRARRLLPAHIDDAYRRVDVTRAWASLMRADVAKHDAAVMEAAIDHAVSVGMDIERTAELLRRPADFVLMRAVIDRYNNKDAEDIDLVRGVANQRALRAPTREARLAWAEAGRAFSQTAEEWDCELTYRKPPSVAAREQAFYRQLAIHVCARGKLHVAHDADQTDVLALTIVRSVETTLAAYRRAVGDARTYEVAIVDRHDYYDVLLRREDGCRLELAVDGSSIPCPANAVREARR